MKIGIITGLLYPCTKSGPAIVTYNLANYLAKKNIEVTIFGAIKQKQSTEIEEYYPKVDLRTHVEKSTFSVLSYQFKYIKQINSKDFDILHLENLPGARGFIIVPLLHALNNNVKIIQKIHGWPPTELNFRFDSVFKRIMYRLHWSVAKEIIHNYSDKIIVNSNFMKETVSKDFHKHIDVIPNGIDLNVWKPAKKINIKGRKNVVFGGDSL
ncbi:glycosyltransferase family 4 protein [Candidatus Methanoperedens nitratireducens]|uniref:Glycosyltransferase subfamily 4-like N-terminal domain-containing protein n=1 Tax=Candidatus Methanoperedens nitratireducens TaxID=1392998 RepID=A0A284VUF7_9EURY|nr:glycosyltransferase family 4 protein [Candidatus Methanoperedens nitroreducens]SNQ62934.1 hypothetical protein MNV_980036 [Candidatus Methanoperedens nitroreducens]